MKARGSPTRAMLVVMAIVSMVMFAALLVSARAQTSSVDWRGTLTCPAQGQTHKGLLYCNDRIESEDPDEIRNIHIIVADLSEPSLRFEYIMPQDYSRGTPRECRDPNRPDWGSTQEGGCLDRDGIHYPTIKLTEAVALVPTYQSQRIIEHSVPLAAVINADYGAPTDTRDHGAEGLIIARGTRLDGADRCDGDFNAALRPWLALGKTVDGSSGLIPSSIDRLPADNANPPDWAYSAFGGGPLLLQGSTPNPEADACISDPIRVIDTTELIENCNRYRPGTPTPPVQESYGNSCYETSHTAAGISSDRRWLFFVINDEKMYPESLASYMKDELGVADALKFDGGGSSALWFAGATESTVNPVPDDRPLSNWMAIHAPDGDGIRLPLDAAPNTPFVFRVLITGETVEMVFTNTGPLSWFPDDGVALQGPGAQPVRDTPEVMSSLQLEEPVPPGTTMAFAWQAETIGMRFGHFQMTQHGQPFGAPARAVIIVAPATLESLRLWAAAAIEYVVDKIQVAFDGWRIRAEEVLDKLAGQFQAELERQLRDTAHRLLTAFLEMIERVLAEGCGGTIALLVIPMVVAWSRRRRV